MPPCAAMSGGHAGSAKASKLGAPEADTDTWVEPS
jgi:hypothetical protein